MVKMILEVWFGIKRSIVIIFSVKNT